MTNATITVAPAAAVTTAAVTTTPVTTATAAVAGDTSVVTHTGSFLVWTADRANNKVHPKPDENAPRPRQDSSDPRARRISFSPRDGKQRLPPDQAALCSEFDKVVDALNHLYPPGRPAREDRFRFFYREVFGLAQLTFERENGFELDFAEKMLDAIKQDIIEEEAPRVKTSKIKDLARWALLISLPAIAAFLVLSHVPDDGYIGGWVKELGGDRAAAANFMLVWVGCCLGVCLSYAIRKPDFRLEDLYAPDSDFLTPAIRIALTGTLAIVLVMFSLLNIVDLKIASNSLSSIGSENHQMLAFIVGVICGIGEQLLPATVLGKTKGLIGGIK